MLLFMAVPRAWADSPAAEQAEVEQQDSAQPPAQPAPEAPEANDKTPAKQQDSADIMKDSHLNAPYVAPAVKVPPAAADAAPDAPKHETPTTAAAAAPDVKPENAALGSLTLRQPNVRLDQISLWREDGDKAAPTDAWDGTVALDVQNILPALVMTKNQHVKDIILRIAMSGVYTPAGMTDIEYVHWRANVLMAQKHPELAARLMNAARLGRASSTDALHRTGYEVAAGEIEAACVESMADGDDKAAFWQGMAVLCAPHLGDADATKKLTDALPDGAIKSAAASSNADDLKNAIIKSSGIEPATKTIPDNHEILAKLSQLLADIQDDDDSKTAATKNKGQLLLLSLGALRATKHGEDTQKLTDQALQLAGF